MKTDANNDSSSSQQYNGGHGDKSKRLVDCSSSGDRGQQQPAKQPIRQPASTDMGAPTREAEWREAGEKGKRDNAQNNEKGGSINDNDGGSHTGAPPGNREISARSGNGKDEVSILFEQIFRA